jgi:hypothetical protein
MPTSHRGHDPAGRGRDGERATPVEADQPALDRYGQVAFERAGLGAGRIGDHHHDREDDVRKHGQRHAPCGQQPAGAQDQPYQDRRALMGQRQARDVPALAQGQARCRRFA